MTTRYRIERLTAGGWEHLAVLTTEDAAMKRLQLERGLDLQAARDGWITQPGTYRMVEVKR